MPCGDVVRAWVVSINTGFDEGEVTQQGHAMPSPRVGLEALAGCTQAHAKTGLEVMHDL